MTIRQLLRQLDYPAMYLPFVGDLDAEITGVMLLSEAVVPIRSDVLYLTRDSDVPQNLNVLIARGDLGSLYRTCQAIFQDELVYMAKSQRILAALLSNNGLQHLIYEAHVVLDRPLFVVDSDFRYIAMNVGTLDDDSAFATVMREEMVHGCILEQGVDYIRSTNLDEITRSRNVPYYHFNDVMQKGLYVSSVRVHNIEVGHLTMVEQGPPFSSIDYRCFLQLVDFVSQEMQKNSFYSANKGQMYSYFLRDLLESEYPNAESVHRRLAMLNFQLKDELYVVVMSSHQLVETAPGTSLLIHKLKPILMDCIYALYQGSLVILFNRKKEVGLSGQAIELLSEIAREYNYVVGISNMFTDIIDVRRSYMQGLRAANLGQGGGEIIYRYQDYAWMDMLELCKSSRKLTEFCHPGVLKLMEYEKEFGGQLMETFYCYLENPFTPRMISENLFIHRNTFAYRLNKIRSILDSDLKNGEELFQYKLSFKVLQYLGLFEPPSI